jgi:hypothetical protein
MDFGLLGHHQLAAGADEGFVRELGGHFARVIDSRWKDTLFSVELELGGLSCAMMHAVVTSTQPGPFRTNTADGWNERGAVNSCGRVGYSHYSGDTNPTLRDGKSPTDVVERVWELTNDNTVAPRNNFGGARYGYMEFVASRLRWHRDAEDFARLLAGFVAAGAITGSSEGSHVHVDRRAAIEAPAGTPEEYAKRMTCLISRVVSAEPLIYRALGVSSNRVTGSPAYASPWPYGRHQSDTMRSMLLSPARVPASGRTSGLNTTYWNDANSARARKIPTIEYRFPNGTAVGDQVFAHVQLAIAINLYASACTYWRATDVPKRRGYPVPNDDLTAAYDWNAFLLGLGMIGEEFKHSREMLLRNMPGDPENRGQGRSATIDSGHIRAAPESNPACAVNGTAGVADARAWKPQTGFSTAKRVWYYRLPDKSGAPHQGTRRYLVLQQIQGRFIVAFSRMGNNCLRQRDNQFVDFDDCRTGRRGETTRGHQRQAVRKLMWIDTDGVGRNEDLESRSIWFDDKQSAITAAARYLERNPRICGE